MSNLIPFLLSVIVLFTSTTAVFAGSDEQAELPIEKVLLTLDELKESKSSGFKSLPILFKNHHDSNTKYYLDMFSWDEIFFKKCVNDKCNYLNEVAIKYGDVKEALLNNISENKKSFSLIRLIADLAISVIAGVVIFIVLVALIILFLPTSFAQTVFLMLFDISVFGAIGSAILILGGLIDKNVNSEKVKSLTVDISPIEFQQSIKELDHTNLTFTPMD